MSLMPLGIRCLSSEHNNCILRKGSLSLERACMGLFVRRFVVCCSSTTFDISKAVFTIESNRATYRWPINLFLKACTRITYLSAVT